ncbi:MAG: hypothetical protein HKO02_14120 [Hyphomonadaceae bacterium]|nr:hypothetical protein [Hyphomonadaceae bacterium]
MTRARGIAPCVLRDALRAPERYESNAWDEGHGWRPVKFFFVIAVLVAAIQL